MNPAVKLDSEFISLLQNKDRPDVRGITMQCVLDMTDSNEGIQAISQSQQCLQELFNICLNETESGLVKLAYKTVINLSAIGSVCWKILLLENYKELLLDMLKVTLNKESLEADLACKFLSNLSRVENCAAKIIEVINTNYDKIGFDKMINAFCMKGYNTQGECLDYLGSVLANLTQIQETRKFILDKERCIIQRILPFISYMDSLVRRRGVITMIKNCCFEIDDHDWLLSDKVDLLPCLLLPLTSATEDYDDEDMDKLPLDLQYLSSEKLREPEIDLRLLLVEAIHKMCTTKSGRQYIRDKNTYIIMRDLDNWETDEAIKKSIQDLIQLLIGDEPTDEHSNLQEVQIPDDVRKQFEEENYENCQKSEK